MPTWLQIGLVGKAHGLRGHFFVSQRDDPLPVALGAKIYLDNTSQSPVYVLEESKMQGKRPIAKLKGIESRSDVETLTGRPLWIERTQLEWDDEQEYLWADLIGKKLLDCNGIVVGAVTDVQNFGASDILTVKCEQTSRKLDIAFVPTYVEMDSLNQDGPIKLVVPLATFEDLWRD